jgi:hypothetical protein
MQVDESTGVASLNASLNFLRYILIYIYERDGLISTIWMQHCD